MLEKEIKHLEELNNYSYQFEGFKNNEDIRSVTNHAICQNTQNFIFAVKLSFKLLDISFCKDELSNHLEEEDLEIVHDNFIGYSKEAYLINTSVIIENHIRQLAHFYQSNGVKILDNSIKKTFDNLLSKCSVFENSLSAKEKEIFHFFLGLRNTMHNVGMHTQNDIMIEIDQIDSIFSFEKIELTLVKDDFNKISFLNLIILIEQVFKIINNLNSKIAETEFIKHRLVDAGFNE